MKDNIIFRIRLLRKKFRDRKIKNKICSAMIFIALFTIIGVGAYSYQIAKQELINNSRQTVSELIRQGKQKLDERKKVFEESSYRILQMSKLETLLGYSEEEAKAFRVRNEGLPSAIMQQSLLYEYTRFALLRPNSGVVYDYFPGGERRWKEGQMNNLLNQLDKVVSMHEPVAWVRIDGSDYFVRQIVTTDLKEKGILIFCLYESFFDYIGNQISYLDNRDIVVMNEQGQTLKGNGSEALTKIQSRFEEICQTSGELIYFEEAHDILAVIHSRNSEWTMAVRYSKDILLSGVNHIAVAITVFFIVAFFISFLMVELISRTITRNIGRIENGMKEFEKGNFRYRVSPASYDEVGLLGLQLNYMAEQIENLMEIQKEDEEKKRQMEIATLQAQINPHFLYNTLGSFKWFAYRAGQRELANSLDALVQLLRFTIKRAADLVTVAEEIEYIKSYVAIEKMRYEDRFQITYELEEAAMDLEIPGFLLQPMVENSLLHGLDMTKENAGIKIKVNLHKQVQSWFLIIEEADNGIGMTEEECKKMMQESSKQKKKGFSSLGIRIVNRRMREIYGSQYHMELLSSPGSGTTIRLWIPVDLEKKEYEKESIDRR